MPAAPAEDVVSRLAALERRLAGALVELDELHATTRRARRSRRLTRTAAGIAIVLACGASYSVGTSAQGDPHSVMAPFVVMGKGGNKVAEIRESSAGNQNQIVVYNHAGRAAAFMLSDEWERGRVSVTDGTDVKVAFGVENGAGAFVVKDANGKTMADMLQGDNGGRGMFIYNSDGEAVVRLLASSTGGGQVLAGSADHPSGLVSDDDTSVLTLVDPSGHRVLEATSKSPNGRRGIWVFNAKDESVATAQVQENGAGSMKVGGPDGRGGAGMFYTGQGSTIALMRDDGTPKFQVASDGLGLYDESGQSAVVWLSSAGGSGVFKLGDAAGQIMVEAGTTQGGRGVVRAGPRIGGPVEMTGLPFAILGRKN